MKNDLSYSFSWTQPWPNWPAAQIRTAQEQSLQAELARLEALDELVWDSDLSEAANLLKSLKKNS